MAHRELGYDVINRLIQDIGDAGTVEFMPHMEGTTLHGRILAPGKKKMPKKAARSSQAARPRLRPAQSATAQAPSPSNRKEFNQAFPDPRAERPRVFRRSA